MVVMMAVVVPGLGGGFRDGATGQKSCGEKTERRVRPGYESQCRLLGFQHTNVPQ